MQRSDKDYYTHNSNNEDLDILIGDHDDNHHNIIHLFLRHPFTQCWGDDGKNDAAKKFAGKAYIRQNPLSIVKIQFKQKKLKKKNWRKNEDDWFKSELLVKTIYPSSLSICTLSSLVAIFNSAPNIKALWSLQMYWIFSYVQWFERC